MKSFLCVISFLWIAMGSCLILYTVQCRDVLGVLLHATDKKILSILAMVLGLLLIIAAPQSGNPWFIVVLGGIAIGKGFFFLLDPKNTFEKLTKWYAYTASDQVYRLFGIIMLMIGTAVYSWV